MTTRTELKWGVVFGVAICVWTLALHFLGFYTVQLQNGQRADNAALIIPLVALYLAIRERRDRAGYLTVLGGIRTGVGTALVSWPISTAFLWFYHSVVNPAWLDLLINWTRQTMLEAGASAAEITGKVESLRSSGALRSQIIGSLVGTLLLSVVLSLVLSAALRRSPSQAVAV